MTEKIKNFILQYDMIHPGEKVLLGVSGGSDSMCLADVMLKLSSEMGFSVIVAHVEHGIRGEESRRDMEFVRDYCAVRNIPFYVKEIDIPALAAERRKGVEQTAREERRAFFEMLCDRLGIDRIATAHQATDNAESVLLNLTRGATVNGLKGMLPCMGRYIRPLLCVEKSETEAYCRENGIDYRVDATNTDTDYSRNHIRHDVIPMLERINPRFVLTVSANSAIIREEDDYLDRIATGLYDSGVVLADGKATVPVSYAGDEVMFRRVLMKMARALGVTQDIYTPHFEAVIRLCRRGVTGKSADLTHGLRCRVSYDKLVMEAVRETDVPETVTVKGFGSYRFGAGTVTLRKTDTVPEAADSHGKYADADKLFARGIVLRTRSDGDVIKPYGSGTKKLKKFFIDRKTERDERDSVPLIASGGEILCVVGTEISERIKIDDSTRTAVEISYNI